MIKEVVKLKLLHTAIGSFCLKLAASGLAFLGSLLLARLLGVKEFGVYAMVMATINVAATVATLGLPALITREVAQSEMRQEWERLRSVISNSRRLVLLASIIILLLASGLISSGTFPTLPLLSVTFAMSLVPLVALNQLRSAILRGLHHVILADIPDLLLRPLLLLLLVAGVYIWHGEGTATVALGLQLAAVVGAFLLGVRYLRRHARRALAPTAFDASVRDWAVQARPFFVMTLVTVVEAYVGIYILGYLAGPAEVGVFQAASQLVALVVMGLVAVNLPLQAKLAVTWALGDRARSQELVSEAAKLGTAVAFVGSLILIPFADSIVALYGPGYEHAGDVLRILVVGQFINAAAGPCGLTLVATGYQKFALYGLIAGLMANIALAFFLVPAHGAQGAAAAAAGGLLVWNSVMVYWAARLAQLHTPVVRVLTSGSSAS